MRFKALPKNSQTALAGKWTAYVAQHAADLFPIVPADIWLRGFRHLNVRIRANGLPSSDAMERVTNWVENLLFGPPPAHGVCDCCGVEY